MKTPAGRIPLRQRPGRARFTSGAAYARLRRRAALRRRRAVDVATNWLLGALVIASVAMAGTLWSGALWASSPVGDQAGAGQPYQIPGNNETGGVSIGIAAPPRIVLLFPSAQGDAALDDPQSAAFAVAWDAVLSLLQQLPVASAQPVGLKEVTARVAAYSGPSPFHGGACRAGAEVDVGASLPWSDWLAEATGAAVPAVPAISVDQLFLLPAGILAAGDVTPSTAPELYVLAGGAAVELPIPSAAFTPLQNALCGLLADGVAAGYAVTPLAPDGASGGLPDGVRATVPDPGAILVPQPGAVGGWREARLSHEPLAADALALSIFPDPLEVRSTEAKGSTIFTSAQHWMLTVRSGQSTLVVPAGAGAAPPWYPSLLDALHYVDLRGGWPAGAWLAGFQTGGSCTILSCSAPTSYTYLFSTRNMGLPVLTTGDSPPPISVTIGAGGDPTFYLRAVGVAGAPTGPAATVTAQAAINAVYLDPPTVFVGQPVEVVSIYPAWAPTGDVLQPVWAVEVDQAPWGHPATELVSAVTGSIVGIWGPA